MPAIERRHRIAIRRGRSALTIAVAATLVACTGESPVAVPTTTSGIATTTTVVTRPADGALSIGIFLPRTGEGAQLGEPMIAAIEAAVAAINDKGGVLGQDVTIEELDEGAGTGPDQLLTSGVDAIIGPASSNVALSQLRNVVDANNGVVTCSPTASALALDGYPDNGFFFRTVPSDSLQMRQIGRRAQQTGADSVAVGYLDDPYGRGLVKAFREDVTRRGLPLVAEIGFGVTQEDLTGIVASLLAPQPEVLVILADAASGGRLLAALDAVTATEPVTIVNDSIRSARQTIQELTPAFRARLIGIAPSATSISPDGPAGFFTAHAVDCVNLIALATVAAESDAPKSIRTNMAAVSTGGRECTSFDACNLLIEQGLQIDYNGLSGDVNLSSTTGDPENAVFVAFGFDEDGVEIDTTPLEPAR